IGEAVVLGQVADAFADLGVAGGLAKQPGFALPAADDAEQHLDQCGLAGAVLAEQAVDLAFLDLDADALQGLNAAVILGQVGRFDDGHGADSPEAGSRNCGQFSTGVDKRLSKWGGESGSFGCHAAQPPGTSCGRKSPFGDGASTTYSLCASSRIHAST